MTGQNITFLSFVTERCFTTTSYFGTEKKSPEFL